LDGLSPVVGAGLVHNKLLELPDTLLGFEATGPPSLRPVGETGEGCDPRCWGRLPVGGWLLSLHLVVGCGV